MPGRGKPSSVSVVIRLPADAAAALTELLAQAPSQGAPPAPVERLHLAVQHVGPTPKGGYEHVVESMRRAASGLAPFELRATSVRTLPDDGPARSIAATFEAPSTLLELKRRLAQRLARNVRKDPADRFTPHITLARLDQPGAIEPFEMSVEGPAFKVASIALVRTRIRPAGSVIEEVGRVTLG